MSATYTVKQVADILGYSTNSIYTFLKEKRIKGVRLGKGRFRIPQSELDRLLVPETPQRLVQQIVSPQIEKIYSPEEPLYRAESDVTQDIRVDVPSLFDWFVGIASIVFGLTMFLFSKGYEEFSISQFAMVLPIIRITLVVGGFGLLLTDVVGQAKSIWHWIFHGCMVLVYAVYTGILFRLGNMESGAIFGSMVVTLLVYALMRMGGLAGFALYVLTLLVSVSFTAIVHPETSSLVRIASSFQMSSDASYWIWVTGVVVITVALIYGYKRNVMVFRWAMVTLSIILIAISFDFAKNLLWGRSFYILLIALMSFFVPVWQGLTFSHKRDRMFVFGSFGSILCLFIIAVGAVRIMQTNIISYAGNELENKATYAKFLLESELANAQSAFVSLAGSQLVIDGIEKEKKDIIIQVLKNVFESNSSLRKIVVVSTETSVLAVYPYAEAEKTTYENEEYVLRAQATKNAVFSEAFESVSDSVKRKNMIIAVPVLNNKNTVIGVVVGFVDASVIGNKLQQIISAKLGEQIMVVDKAGKYVLHQDPNTIGMDAQSQDISLDARSASKNIVSEESIEGSRSLIVYREVEHPEGWAVGAATPVMSILQVTPAATLTIFTLTSVSLLIIGVFLMSHRVKHVVGTSDSHSFDVRAGSHLEAAQSSDLIARKEKQTKKRLKGDTS